MKYVKILGLLAVAAAALMAFAGSASATVITSPTGTAVKNGTLIHAEAEPNAAVTAGKAEVGLHNDTADIHCKSTVTFEVGHTTVAGTTTGPIKSLEFTECTEGWTVTVNTLGRLEVHKAAGSNYNGTLTSYGTKVTASNHFINCVYETNGETGTDIGTITGGSPATLDIEASIPRVGGSFLCGGANAAWTGSYVSTNAYYID